MFITLEGCEGSGKSSVIKAIAMHIADKYGRKVVSTNDPGGCDIAMAIRKVLLSSGSTNLCKSSELLLYQASRNQLVQEVIKPALMRGEVVVCDRFLDSTRAYQGSRGWDDATIGWLEGFSEIHKCLPDLTLYLDVIPETGLERSKKRLADGNIDEGRFEAEEINFHNQVRNIYYQLSQSEDRIVKIDANQPLADVINDCLRIVDEFYSAFL